MGIECKMDAYIPRLPMSKQLAPSPGGTQRIHTHLSYPIVVYNIVAHVHVNGS